MLGRQVLWVEINSDDSININSLSEGFYNLTILNNNKIITSKKFIKN